MSYYSFTMARLVTPSGIIILCIFAWAVSEIDVQNKLQKIGRWWNWVLSAGIAIIFVTSVVSSVHIARKYMEENRNPSFFPVDIADYMIDHKSRGRIFNDYGTGGYLIYRLSPDVQVYIDGRTGILYPLDHLYSYMGAINSSELMRTEIEKYDIEFAVLSNKQSNYSLARNTGILRLDFVGNRYSLFKRDNSSFPVFGTLLASPACWNPEMSSDIAAERSKARQILPANSTLHRSLIDLIVNYGNARNKTAFLKGLQVNTSWSAFKLRFTAYQALSTNLDQMAYHLFTQLSEKEFSDYLGAALAQARLGDWRKVEQILDEATRLTVSFKSSEISILYDLLVQVRENSGLELFNKAYVDQIGNTDASRNNAIQGGLPEVSAFCPKI